MPERPLTVAPPLAGAVARMDLDRLVIERRRALIGGAHTERTDAQHDDAARTADLLDALVRTFADEVDRANADVQTFSPAGHRLPYESAVVVIGDRGPVVTDLPAWQATPLAYEVEAGEVEQVLVGADVLAYLRTGDADAAEALGLA